MTVYTHLDVASHFSGRFPWKTRYFIHRDGIRQAYYDEGPSDADLTFVCLHGNPTWSYIYRRFIERLSSRHRVVAIDHVGFGRSDKPTDPAYYSLATHITNLRFLLEEVAPRRVVLVVHDWGGPIGMGWAVCDPEALAGVVVLNSFAFVEDPPIKLPWLFKLLVLGRGGWRRVVEKNLFVEFFLRSSGRKRLSKIELDPYRAPFPTPRDRVGIARFPQMIPETKNRTHESWGTLSSIEHTLTRLRKVPALICWGMKDPGFKAPVRERWATVFENVDGPHLFPDAGHFIQENAADAILDHIDRWVDQTVLPHAGARHRPGETA